jgi:hypothetical protein
VIVERYEGAIILDPEVESLTSLIIQACSRGWGVDACHVLDDVLHGDQTLWIIRIDGKPIAVATTRLDEWHGDATAVRVMCAGGDGGPRWAIPLRDALRDHARAIGASIIITEGRLGWGRLLGLKPARYVFEDPL